MSWLVRVQADDFFNAYRVLKESNEIMMGKLEKLSGKPLVSETAFGAFPVSTPGIVCLAFSLELYVKNIYYALNMEHTFPRGRDGHNILKLFEGLPEEVRQEIFSHDAISQNPFATRGNPLSPKIFSKSYTPYERFIDQIKAISDGFEKWRYSYENGALQYESWFAEALIQAFKSAADSARRRSAA